MLPPSRPLRHSLSRVLRAIRWLAYLGAALFVSVCVLSFMCTSGLREMAKRDRAHLGLTNIEVALRSYVRRTGHPLPLDGGLEVLVEAHELETLPLDPWGHRYVLRAAHPGIAIVTLGRDGVEGGEGHDADILQTVRLDMPAPNSGDAWPPGASGPTCQEGVGP